MSKSGVSEGKFNKAMQLKTAPNDKTTIMD